MQVNLLDLSAQYAGLKEDILAEISQIMETNQYILGPAVSQIETMMQDFNECRHAIGCASGTDALVLALQALEIGTDDEVITTPFTFFASASAIHRVGAKTVFADIKPDTFNLDPEKLEAAITPATKAIVVVHLFGQPAEMDKIMQIADKHKLKVIEDNAQGIGARYDGKVAGTFGDIGTLSFFPSKNLGCMGDGGMCLTNNAELADRLQQLRVHGEKPKYFHQWVGLNSRLDSIQAAVLQVKLPLLDGWSKSRRRNANYYFQQLADLPQITLPQIHPQAESIFNQFTILAESRDELQKFLQAQQIGCAIYYPLPLHLQECFSYLGYAEGDFPVAEKTAKSVLSIPIYPELSRKQQDYVIEKIRDFYK
ncbi:MAG: DegT/DnrJ/EryC1/StrS family aminotransferase [Candidatus Cloacimonadales bacterium]